MKLQYLHPFLFAIAPVVFLWERNFAEAPTREAVPAMAVSFIFGALVFACVGLLYRNSKKAALLTSALLFLSLFFDQLFFNSFTIRFMKHAWALSIVLIIAVLIGILLWRTKKDLIIPNKVLAAISGMFVLLSLVQLGTHFYKNMRTVDALKQNKISIINTENKEERGIPPDIYYIIFDEYAAPSTIKDVMGYEEAEEINVWLEDRGFFIPKESRSNYQTTKFSIPSSLNMRYLTDEEVKDKNALTRLTLDHSLKDALKAYGYNYINLGAKWVNYYNPFADENITYSHDYLSPFQTALWQLTVFSKAGAALDKTLNIQTSPVLDERLMHWYNVQFKFDELAKISEREDGPNFVFAHFLLPHVPDAFDAEGNYVSRFKSAKLDSVKKYIDQVAFTNSKIKELTEALIEKSETEPVIVMQGDHGWRVFADPMMMERFQLEPEQGKALRYNIFNAYYLPNKGNESLPLSMTPVNSFRTVLNYYFDQNLEFLEDIFYGVDSPDGPPRVYF
ncbi:hypothetical protein CL629_04385 [bacterium]|nr:hypothetical protein [bacterium]|tara:strand:+ start:4403 stop:5920 length:1518 start_codon:yes stop_codon:yes gene_type:complete